VDYNAFIYIRLQLHIFFKQMHVFAPSAGRTGRFIPGTKAIPPLLIFCMSEDKAAGVRSGRAFSSAGMME